MLEFGQRRRDADDRQAAVAFSLALTDPKKLAEPITSRDAGAGNSPWSPPAGLRDGDTTRHDVGTVKFDEEKWW